MIFITSLKVNGQEIGSNSKTFSDIMDFTFYDTEKNEHIYKSFDYHQASEYTADMKNFISPEDYYVVVPEGYFKLYDYIEYVGECYFKDKPNWVSSLKPLIKIDDMYHIVPPNGKLKLIVEEIVDGNCKVLNNMVYFREHYSRLVGYKITNVEAFTKTLTKLRLRYA